MAVGIRTENHPSNSNELPYIYQPGSMHMDDYDPACHSAAKQTYLSNYETTTDLVGSQKPVSTWIRSLIKHELD
jgi:hypothetical protein